MIHVDAVRDAVAVKIAPLAQQHPQTPGRFDPEDRPSGQ
jgi:hypothetical protein